MPALLRHLVQPQFHRFAHFKNHQDLDIAKIVRTIYLVGMLIQLIHSNYMLCYGQNSYYSIQLFCPSSPPTFNIAETPFKHQNVQLGRESMAITFVIHNLLLCTDRNAREMHVIYVCFLSFQAS